MTMQSVSEYFGDSIVTACTSGQEIKKEYLKNKLTSEKTSTLLNGQPSRMVNKHDKFTTTTEYGYNGNGDLSSVKSIGDRSTSELFYLYLSYDEKGNWTKRVVVTTPGNITRGTQLEIRLIEYY